MPAFSVQHIVLISALCPTEIAIVVGGITNKFHWVFKAIIPENAIIEGYFFIIAVKKGLPAYNSRHLKMKGTVADVCRYLQKASEVSEVS